MRHTLDTAESACCNGLLFLGCCLAGVYSLFWLCVCSRIKRKWNILYYNHQLTEIRTHTHFSLATSSYPTSHPCPQPASRLFTIETSSCFISITRQSDVRGSRVWADVGTLSGCVWVTILMLRGLIVWWNLFIFDPLSCWLRMYSSYSDGLSYSLLLRKIFNFYFSPYAALNLTITLEMPLRLG